MTKLVRVIGWTLSACVLFAGTMYVASEGAGEVVVLHSRDSAGVWRDTSLWVVEADGDLWLRAGMQSNAWLARVERTGEVELTRRGQRTPYLAIPDPSAERREQIHSLMRQRYGWGDLIIGFTRDGSRSVPVRLQPVSALQPGESAE